MQSLQDRYAPSGKCFGCGPTNSKGLQIKSYVDGDGLICRFHPQPHHLAFTGVLNGGICGTLLDCHSNWTALWTLMQQLELDTAPLTVTADFHVKLLRPTPMDGEIIVRASAIEVAAPRVVVEATLESGGKVTASCRGTFVRVLEGHPAFADWG
jgi:acyl-coenzyme A thioesterase PaaI-like protein